MGNTTDSVNNDGMPPEALEVLEQDESYISGRRGAGVFCDYMTEPIPIFIDATCEKVIDHGNSWIVFRQRSPSIQSIWIWRTRTYSGKLYRHSCWKEPYQHRSC